MGCDEFRNQRQSQPRTIGLGRDERLEEVLAQVGRNPRPIVCDPHFKRRASDRFARRRTHPDAVSIGGIDPNGATPVTARMGGLGGVLHEVEEDLDELILVSQHRRQ